MKCPEVLPWLSSTRPGQPLPASVSRHLKRCPNCQRQQRQLEALDDRVKQLATPVPPISPEAKKQLLDRIARTPQVRHPAGPSRWPHILKYGAFAAAAAVLVAVGWYFGQMGQGPPTLIAQKGEADEVEPRQAKNDKSIPKDDGQSSTIVEVAAPKSDARPLLRRDLYAQLLTEDIRLAKASITAEQIEPLFHISEHLRAEADVLAKNGPLEELPAVVEAYEYVLKQGLVARARALPKVQRGVLLSSVIVRLKDSLTVPSFDTEPVPLIADLFASMRRSATEAIDALEDKTTASLNVTPVSMSPNSLLGLLVQDAVRLSAESDPLKKAEICSELAQRLAPATVLLAADGQSEQVKVLSDQMHELMQNGVLRNLERARRNQAHQEKMEQIHKHASCALDLLDKNLQVYLSRQNMSHRPPAPSTLHPDRGNPGDPNRKTNPLVPPMKGSPSFEKGKVSFSPDVQKKLIQIRNQFAAKHRRPSDSARADELKGPQTIQATTTERRMPEADR
jgi:hypothetical protein